MNQIDDCRGVCNIPRKRKINPFEPPPFVEINKPLFCQHLHDEDTVSADIPLLKKFPVTAFPESTAYMNFSSAGYPEMF
jgi:hypothetical protein